MSVLMQLPVEIPEVEGLSPECRPEGAGLIKVESPRQGARCSRGGRETHHVPRYDRPIQLRQRPMRERPGYREIRPQRYWCSPCAGRPTTTPRCDWYDPNRPHPKALEKGALRCRVNSTVVEGSPTIGLGPDAGE